VPPGTTRYWSWLFADTAARDPLIGIYALTAEWRALIDPASDASVAQIKLTWWRDEIRRLVAGSPLHPVTRYIARLPHADAARLSELERVVEAAAAQLAGVPLERAGELEPHAGSLYGIPLLAAVQLTNPLQAGEARACIGALAAAEYLSRALADYRREARAGRVPFPVDELLAAQIDNDDLTAEHAPPRLQIYLDQLNRRAAVYFATAAHSLSSSATPELRHLMVIATLGIQHLKGRKHPSSADFSLTDLYNAWKAARRAAAAR
jgi:phytoene synthase